MSSASSAKYRWFAFLALVAVLMETGCSSDVVPERRVTVVFPPVARPAYEHGCVMEKLATPDFRQQFLAFHYDLIVRLDVEEEYQRYTHDAQALVARSGEQSPQALASLAKRLTAAKQQRLEGSRSSIVANVDSGPEVVVRVEEWADICELSNNPHVMTVWLNLPTRPNKI